MHGGSGGQLSPPRLSSTRYTAHEPSQQPSLMQQEYFNYRRICSFKGINTSTVKPVFIDHSKRTQKFGLQYRLSLNAGQKYCRMLQVEHSAILSTFIKLPFVIKIYVLYIFEWPLKTGFTIIAILHFYLEYRGTFTNYYKNISWL